MEPTPVGIAEEIIVAEFFDGGRVVTVSTGDGGYVYRYIRREQVVAEADTLLSITRCVFDAVESRRRR